MDEPTMSLGDLFELVASTGLSRRTLQHWAKQGYLPCAVASGGTGEQRKWTLPEALGVLVACRVYTSTRGCALSYLSIVVRGFARHPLAHWRKKAGRSPGLMMAHETGSGEPYTAHIELERKLPDRIDVREALADLTAAVERMSARPGIGPEGGRKRGLAGTRKERIKV
jgi:hypothetical protein